MRVSEHIVSVIEDRDQAEVGHRSEHRGPSADHDPDLAPAGTEESRVPLLRPHSRRQRNMLALTEHSDQGSIQSTQVTTVGHDDYRTPATIGRGGNCFGIPARPVLPWRRRPHRPRHTTLGQGAQKSRSSTINRPLYSGQFGCCCAW
jgi:hypothetical protein